MKQGYNDWLEKRRQSSRTLAFWFESKGLQWTSLREAVHIVAASLGIETAKKRRSQIAVACHDALLAKGFGPPDDFIPPWLRNTFRPPILRQRQVSDPRI